MAASTAALDRTLGGAKCVVAVLGGNEPSYVLFGLRIERDARYARLDDQVIRRYGPIVLGPDIYATPLVTSGWTINQLSGFWKLATRPHIPGSNPPCQA